MLLIFKNAWALLLGLLLLMLGNGLQGTLLGVRGGIEGFDAADMSWVMSAYFLGLLTGSRVAPQLIRRVGHVRVFAALASVISAAFILYAAVPNLWAWGLLRLIVGICFAGVYVVVESWLNDAATNETRGKALSLYMITMMVAIVGAQGLMTLADPAGWMLFVVISVLVSVSFAPILLSVSPAPVFDMTAPMSLKRLFVVSPLAAAGQIMLGAAASAMFSMSAVWGGQAGLTVAQISGFIATVYLGGLLSQYPIGWLSDRMDRRTLIVAVAGLGAGSAALAFVATGLYPLLLVAAFGLGSAVNPLYSMLIAHANDYLEPKEMAAASGGMLFLNGIGSICGPLTVGFLMERIAPDLFFVHVGCALAALCLYGLWRMTRRASVPLEEQAGWAPVLSSASPVAMELAQEVAAEQYIAAEEEREAAANDGAPEAECAGADGPGERRTE